MAIDRNIHITVKLQNKVVVSTLEVTATGEENYRDKDDTEECASVGFNKQEHQALEILCCPVEHRGFWVVNIIWVRIIF